jgi:hypothetical protein
MLPGNFIIYFEIEVQHALCAVHHPKCMLQVLEFQDKVALHVPLPKIPFMRIQKDECRDKCGKTKKERTGTGPG